MKKGLLTVLALMVAGVAFADSYLYVDDFYVQRSMMDTGEKITLPVRAHFDARVSSWEMTFSLPEGLYLYDVVSGYDMSHIPYMNADGNMVTMSGTLQILNGVYVGTSSRYNEGYWYPYGSGALEPYGLVKWEAGDYEEMLQLIFYATSDFNGGEVCMETTTYAGSDDRGGTVNENNDAGQSYFTSAYYDVEDQWVTPAPIISFEPDFNGVNVSVSGDGLLRAEIWVNGILYDTYDIDNECPGEPSWYIMREYYNSQYIIVTATACIPGMIETTINSQYYQEAYPPMESPAPIISYEVHDDYVIVWSNLTGELPVYDEQDPWVNPEISDEFCLFLDGEQVPNPYYVDRPGISEGALVLNFSSYCRILHGTESEWTYATVVIQPVEIHFMVDDICYCTIGNNEAGVIINDWCGSYSGKVVIPENVTWEGETFTVTSVMDWAFDANGGVTDVTLPSTMRTIGEKAFRDCYDLATISCYAVVPPSVETDCFLCVNYTDYDVYQQATLFVPYESLDAYRAHEEWGRFTHIVPFVGAGPGDVDGDGNIGINDVTTLIDQLLSSDEQPAWMDVNGDGVVGIADVTHIIDMILSGDI